MNKRIFKPLQVGKFFLKRLICYVFFIYAALLAFAFVRSNKMIFPVPPASYEDGPDIIKIKTEDGAIISAMYLINPDAEYTVLYSHGNYVDLGRLAPFLQEYNSRGFSIIAYDYHGYGTSQGQPTEKNAYRDIEAVFKYITEKAGISPDKLILHGRSVGTGPAVYLATKRNIAGLILQSSFVTAFRVLTRVTLLPFDKFENIDRIDKINCPVLFIHGQNDSTIPIWHSKKLYEKAKEPKLSCWLEAATHDDIPPAGEKKYWQAIFDFTELIENKIAI